jgi:SAM-dependent methyltransferase
MTATPRPNQDQSTLWNEASGHAWVEMQATLDRMLAPFETLLIEQGLDDQTRRVLDVGCGSGSTTFAAARRLGKQQGSAVGIDISAPLLEVANQRARRESVGNAAFVNADAQTHAFEPQQFDAVISRFGVMFFDDPVAAFTNIRRAARSDARLSFVAWRSRADNPFMTAAARAAAPLLPSLPTPDPNAPGQFALADPDRVRRILGESGWSRIDLRPIDVPTSVPKQDLFVYVTKMGPVGAALREADAPTRERVTAAVRAGFEPFIQNDEARFKSACWLVTARA